MTLGDDDPPARCDAQLDSRLVYSWFCSWLRATMLSLVVLSAWFLNHAAPAGLAIIAALVATIVVLAVRQGTGGGGGQEPGGE